jgi:hypothetical protein
MHELHHRSPIARTPSHGFRRWPLLSISAFPYRLADRFTSSEAALNVCRS